MMTMKRAEHLLLPFFSIADKVCPLSKERATWVCDCERRQQQWQKEERISAVRQSSKA